MWTKSFALALVFVTASHAVPARVAVDTLHRNCFDFSSSLAIPRVRALDSASEPIAERMNQAIDDRFMQILDTSVECRWTDLEFSWKIREHVLWIDWTGVYYGAYETNGGDVFVFDLDHGGDPVERLDFQPELFFCPGSFSKIAPTWMEGCKAEIENATECAEGSVPYCSCRRPTLGFTDSAMVIALGDDCFPHVIQACSPVFSSNVPLRSLVRHLSPLGKKILLRTRYLKSDMLGRYLIYERFARMAPGDGPAIEAAVEAFYPPDADSTERDAE